MRAEDFAEGFFVGQERHSEVVLVVDVERGAGNHEHVLLLEQGHGECAVVEAGKLARCRAPTNA